MSNRRSLSGDELANVILDVEELACLAHTYRQLYATERGVRAVNSVAHDTFGLLLRTLKQAMAIGVARTVLDPPVSGNFENLGLHTLICYAAEADDPLVVRLDGLKQQFEGLQTIRHKLFAHRDRETILSLAAGVGTVLPSLKDTDILDAIDEVVSILDAYFGREGGSFSPTLNTDVEDLISVLNESLEGAV